MLRGLLLTESASDCTGSCTCSGLSLAALLLGRRKISLLLLGFGALPQELGHAHIQKLGRAVVSAAMLGRQQVGPLNPLWGGGLASSRPGRGLPRASCRAPRSSRRPAHSPPEGC